MSKTLVFLLVAFSISSVCTTCPYALLPDPMSVIARSFTIDTLKSYVQFSLYTRDNVIGRRICESRGSLAVAGFDRNHPVRFIVHGFLNYEFSAVNSAIKSAYLEKGDYNIIIVDWSQISALPFYMSVSSHVYQVGDVIGMMAVFLNSQFNVSLDNMYIIGHSLGAQVAGAAGRYILATTNAKLNTIIALDPAGPNFEHRRSLKEKLSKNDATYVESIHTERIFGYDKGIGHASFYPNFGDKQHGCTTVPLFHELCSHFRAFKYFAESINSEVGFWGKKCSSYDEIESETCTYPSRIMARMGGEPSNHNREGIFYVYTAPESPYALGALNATRIQSLMDVMLFSPNHKKGIRVEPTETKSFEVAEFDPALPVRFLVCDYSKTYPARLCHKVVRAYLQKGDYNIFEFDWRTLQAAYKTQVFDDDISASIVDLTRALETQFGLGANQITVVALGNAARIVSYAAKGLAPARFHTLFAIGYGQQADLRSATYVQAIEVNKNFASNLADSTVYVIPKLLCGFNCGPELALDAFVGSVISPAGLTGSTCFMVTFLQSCAGRGPRQIVINDPVNRKLKGKYYYKY